jgi:hypothetical protein
MWQEGALGSSSRPSGSGPTPGPHLTTLCSCSAPLASTGTTARPLWTMDYRLQGASVCGRSGSPVVENGPV